ncbi:sugar phosphate isomerase/epimerase family protein [Chitinophaga sp. GCM10012297]|uniref:Sugar phosphate isomerase/epimerase n=1 Tax=Chitinophaga chungangae TaxID=2821488 RepID=A0ABS3YAX3_9BACT|nr:sugar phosphate isomerase/epimerase family protein [Chitinophaga chungangae]MBO9151804.1 sugar phosphate isomerase/epimerase [Chitinophaga chungangae]
MMNNIRLGVSTWLWTSPFTTATVALFPKIRAMGYEAVEIPVEYPEQIDARTVKKALEDNGLEPVVCGAFGPTRDLTNDDPAVHENCFAYIRQCFDLCNAWGAGFVAGPMYSAVGKARMVPPEQRKKEWQLAVHNLRKVCVEAQSAGLSIAIEPLNRFESDLVNTAEDVKRLVTEIDHPSAGILLDGFHMSIEEKSMEEAIVTAGDRLLHVQVSENYRGVPGTGQTPWNSLRRGLERTGYKGVVSIESFTPEIKELAGAVCIWKNLADSQDGFAEAGYQFLKTLLK